MKLKNIRIEKLFGLEQNNFDIALYPEEKVTLLYGFNGLGKTSIIKLISAVISCDLPKLLDLMFTTVELIFEDSTILTVKRNPEYKEKNIQILRMKSIRHNLEAFHPISYEETSPTGEKLIYKFKLIGGERKRAQYNDDNPRYLEESSFSKLRLLQSKLQTKVDMHIIFGNRDFNRLEEPNQFGAQIRFKHNNLNKKKILCTYNEAKNIVETLSQQIREIENDNPDLWHSSYNPILKKELKHFISSKLPKGLRLVYFTEIPDKLIELNQTLFNSKKTKYPKEKIALFEDIINRRLGLLYKNIKFYDSAIKLVSIYKNDPEVALEALSSGEKNIICLFLELIFLGTENSVFFIDEPETSLHIEWQSHLVDCLLEVCNKYNIQVIIATHAPEIIGEYDGLTTEITSERFRYGNKFFDN